MITCTKKIIVIVLVLVSIILIALAAFFFWPRNPIITEDGIEVKQFWLTNTTALINLEVRTYLLQF
jgi:hypothetical protein